MVLSPEQMRALLEKMPGKNPTQQVLELVRQSGAAERTVWRYLDSGVPERTNRLVKENLLQLAKQHGVIGDI